MYKPFDLYIMSRPNNKLTSFMRGLSVIFLHVSLNLNVLYLTSTLPLFAFNKEKKENLHVKLIIGMYLVRV